MVGAIWNMQYFIMFWKLIQSGLEPVLYSLGVKGEYGQEFLSIDKDLSAQYDARSFFYKQQNPQ